MMSKKSESISFEPIPLTEEDDIDPSKSFDVQKFNESINRCCNKAVSLIEKDFNIQDTRGIRFELKNIISGMKDTHEVIAEIYGKYAEKEKSKNLCAIPLVRTQVESVYLTALIFREPEKWLEEFRSYSWRKRLHKVIYENEEVKNIKRLSKNKKINDLMKPLPYEELEAIEEKVKKGDPSIKGFPGPKKIIETIHTTDISDKILDVLKRLYIEYIWLSSYTHGSTMTGYAREFFNYKSEFHHGKILESDVRDPIYSLNFLSILIVLTDLQKVIKDPVELRVLLSEAWEQFENSSILSKIVWKNWAKIEMGAIR